VIDDKVYIFRGGDRDFHRQYGNDCIKAWQFGTDDRYWMVHFLEDLKDDSPMCEICHHRDLEEKCIDMEEWKKQREARLLQEKE
jgi:hypothetical protein